MFEAFTCSVLGIIPLILIICALGSFFEYRRKRFGRKVEAHLLKKKIAETLEEERKERATNCTNKFLLNCCDCDNRCSICIHNKQNKKNEEKRVNERIKEREHIKQRDERRDNCHLDPSASQSAVFYYSDHCSIDCSKCEYSKTYKKPKKKKETAKKGVKK